MCLLPLALRRASTYVSVRPVSLSSACYFSKYRDCFEALMTTLIKSFMTVSLGASYSVKEVRHKRVVCWDALATSFAGKTTLATYSDYLWSISSF
jgi:hypothetical protein